MNDAEAKQRGLQGVIDGCTPVQGILVDRHSRKRKMGEKFVVRGLGVVQVVGYLEEDPIFHEAQITHQISA